MSSIWLERSAAKNHAALLNRAVEVQSPVDVAKQRIKNRKASLLVEPEARCMRPAS